MCDCPFALALAKKNGGGLPQNQAFNGRELNVFLANSLSEMNVRSARYYVYAHQSLTDVYIGSTDDVVRRWREHNQAAFNIESTDYNQPFKIKIRSASFKHIILAISNNESTIRELEAAAIEFYKPSLNVRPEAIKQNLNCNFSDLNKQTLMPMRLSQNSRTGSTYSRSESDRQEIIAEVYIDRNRKRLRPIQGQIFSQHLNIECARDERNKLNVGDRVRVKVALTTKSNGQQHLVAAKTAALRKL